MMTGIGNSQKSEKFLFREVIYPTIKKKKNYCEIFMEKTIPFPGFPGEFPGAVSHLVVLTCFLEKFENSGNRHF